MKKLFSIEEEDYIRSHYQSVTYSEIARELNSTELQVRGWINHNCPSKLRAFDKGYFHEINTPEKAYWLGFIYADGWVVSNTARRNYELGIQLQSTDDEHLRRFVTAIRGTHKITYADHTKYICGHPEQSVTHVTTVRIYSKQIVSDLIRHGVVERKTQSAIFPTVDKFFMDFLRGYFDGDGCLYVAPKRYRSQLTIVSAHAEVLQYISDVLQKQYGIKSSIYQELKHKFRLHVFGKHLLPLLDLMYANGDAICLQRKKDKYLALKTGPTYVETRGE